MMSPSKKYLIFAVSLFAISTASGNYGYDQQRTVCDRGAYDRAQNTIRLEMNSPRGVLQSGQPPYNQPYGGQSSGMTNSYQGDSQQQIDQQCRTIRQSFKDLLMFTPLCEQIGGYTFQNTASLLEQARQFMRTHCERNEGPLHSQCFKSFEINQCESQFSSSRSRLAQNPVNTQVNSGYNSQSNYPGSSSYNSGYNNQPVTYELCQAFNSFRHCVSNATARQCYGDDQMHQYSYLYDHGRNLAYSCSPTQTPIIGSGYPNQMSGSMGTDYSRRTDLSYPNRNYPNSNYPASGYPNSNYPNSNYPNSNIPGSGSYPNAYPGQNSFSGRNLPTYQQAGNYPMSSINRAYDPSVSGPVVDLCIARVQPYESACTELLVQRQRDARHGRSSNDVQRRICCAIFYYRDCLSRVVLEHCRESTRTVVDLIMGDRNRELTTNCRDYTREQCSGVTSLQASLLTVALATLLLLLRF